MNSSLPEGLRTVEPTLLKGRSRFTPTARISAIATRAQWFRAYSAASSPPHVLRPGSFTSTEGIRHTLSRQLGLKTPSKATSYPQIAKRCLFLKRLRLILLPHDARTTLGAPQQVWRDQGPELLRQVPLELHRPHLLCSKELSKQRPWRHARCRGRWGR